MKKRRQLLSIASKERPYNVKRGDNVLSVWLMKLLMLREQYFDYGVLFFLLFFCVLLGVLERERMFEGRQLCVNVIRGDNIYPFYQQLF